MTNEQFVSTLVFSRYFLQCTLNHCFLKDAIGDRREGNPVPDVVIPQNQTFVLFLVFVSSTRDVILPVLRPAGLKKR